MTKAHVNRLDNESLSALLDGEQTLNDATIASDDVATFGRYALIGDAMRAKENNNNMDFDISERISLALESEPVYADFWTGSIPMWPPPANCSQAPGQRAASSTS